MIRVPYRKLIFWAHLAAGLVIGAFVLSMSVTGILISFEPQLIEWSERHVRTVEAPGAGKPRAGLDAIVAGVRAENPGASPSDVRVFSDPTASVAIGLGKEKGTVFADPYTGRILGKDSRLNAFLHKVEEWHRWLGSRKIFKPVIDAVSLAFFFMILSGLYLWFPRRRTRAAFKAVSVPDLKLKGKARDWNWHNAFGLWAAPLLLVTVLTGAIIGYRWAGDLLFVLTGNTPPPRPAEGAAKAGGAGGKGERGERSGRAGKSGGEPGSEPRAAQASLDSLLARAESKVPAWTAISLRLPQKPGAPVNAFIQEPGFWRKHTRSQLTLDAATSEVVKWEPYSGYNLGRKLRLWVVPVHTGRAAGIPGQILAAFAAFSAGLLVWTGMAMSWRRFFKAKANAPAAREPAAMGPRIANVTAGDSR